MQIACQIEPSFNDPPRDNNGSDSMVVMFTMVHAIKCDVEEAKPLCDVMGVG